MKDLLKLEGYFCRPMPRYYTYVGPQTLAPITDHSLYRMQVNNSHDIIQWLTVHERAVRRATPFIATFIINTTYQLWIADQRSEHVACAAGQEVLAAGEMTFQMSDGQPEVVAVTNQSVGYCPEPDSWDVVAAVLNQLGFAYPMNFTTIFLFRRCEHCDIINLVKDDDFICAVCQSPLPLEWNCGHR